MRVYQVGLLSIALVGWACEKRSGPCPSVDSVSLLSGAQEDRVAGAPGDRIIVTGRDFALGHSDLWGSPAAVPPQVTFSAAADLLGLEDMGELKLQAATVEYRSAQELAVELPALAWSDLESSASLMGLALPDLVGLYECLQERGAAAMDAMVVLATLFPACATENGLDVTAMMAGGATELDDSLIELATRFVDGILALPMALSVSNPAGCERWWDGTVQLLVPLVPHAEPQPQPDGGPAPFDAGPDTSADSGVDGAGDSAAPDGGDVDSLAGDAAPDVLDDATSSVDGSSEASA